MDTGIMHGRNGVVKLALRLFSVTPNSAGCERVFSGFGIIHAPHRSKLNAQKVHNAFTVKLDMQHDLDTSRKKRKFGTDGVSVNLSSTPQGPPNSSSAPPQTTEPEQETDEDPTDFPRHAAELVADAHASDQPEAEDELTEQATVSVLGPSNGQAPSAVQPVAPSASTQVPPLVVGAGNRHRRKYPLATLFDYTSDPDVGVGFYWKGGLENIDALEQMHDTIHAALDSDASSPNVS